MKKNFLQGIPASAKIEFLNKLQSGRFELLAPYEPQPPLNFDLQEDGLYLCRETRVLFTKQEIEDLPGYRMSIELVSKREQVSGEKPPSSISLMPYSKVEYLNSLLRGKNDIIVTWDDSSEQKPFKSHDCNYSFNDLMRINHETTDIAFIMDQKAREKYVELLEKWC
jgi:hypothetical protein